MAHFASINVRSRRVLARNAVLRSFYSCTSQKKYPRRRLSALQFITPLIAIPLSSTLFQKNSDNPSNCPSKSHRHARIHRASGSLQTALS
jgi:hypothetical protein